MKMSLPCRLRQPVALTRFEYQFHRTRQVDLVADRDVQRLGAQLGADDAADHFMLVEEGDRIAGAGAGLAVSADEAGLGAADGWDAEPEAHVAGNADAAGMRESLSVDHHHVGPMP